MTTARPKTSQSRSAGPSLYRVGDGLFIRGHTLGINRARLIDALRNRNVTLVVCVALRQDALFAQEAAAAGITYAYRPLSDGSYVPATVVDEIVALVLDTLARGASVLVHCDSGRNRSALIATLALQKHAGIAAPAAIAAVRTGRPCALANKTFEHYVLHGREATLW